MVEKKASTPKKKKASSSVMIITMMPVATVSLRVGQWTLRGLGADLTDEFAGGGFGHVVLPALFADRKAPRGPDGRRGCVVT